MVAVVELLMLFVVVVGENYKHTYSLTNTYRNTHTYNIYIYIIHTIYNCSVWYDYAYTRPIHNLYPDHYYSYYMSFISHDL